MGYRGNSAGACLRDVCQAWNVGSYAAGAVAGRMVEEVGDSGYFGDGQGGGVGLYPYDDLCG
jgi:hypothetical protein